MEPVILHRNPCTVNPRDEEALGHARALARLGWDVKAVIDRIIGKIEATESEAVPDDAVGWDVPTVPPPLEEHFQNEMQCNGLVPGRSYSLTSGQRDILRERYGLTPGLTVTLTWLQVWKGTQTLRSLRLESDVHHTEEQRKHVLRSVVIDRAWEFFREALRRDAEKAEGKGTAQRSDRGAKPRQAKASVTVLPSADDFLTGLASELCATDK